MKKGWLIAGAILGCSVGTSLSACSSSSSPGTGNSTTTTTATNSSSSGTGGTMSSSSSSSSSGTGGTTTTTTGTGNCSKIGTIHPPPADAGAGTGMTIYCPFSATTDGGPEEYCAAATQHCCETPEGSATPSACQPTATACATGSTDWGCQDPVADCASGDTCCAPSATLVLGMPAGMCGNYASGMKSTTCLPAGTTCTGIIMCTTNAECPAAHPTCTAFEKAGAQVGGCM